LILHHIAQPQFAGIDGQSRRLTFLKTSTFSISPGQRPKCPEPSFSSCLNVPRTWTKPFLTVSSALVFGGLDGNEIHTASCELPLSAASLVRKVALTSKPE